MSVYDSSNAKIPNKIRFIRQMGQLDFREEEKWPIYWPAGHAIYFFIDGVHFHENDGMTVIVVHIENIV